MQTSFRKLFLAVVLLMMTVSTACAENYPYRSDFLWVTTPDHAD